LSDKKASPGEYVTISACIPPVTSPADVYLLARTPTGVIFSVGYDGSIQEGTYPYVRWYANTDYLCPELYVHKVCKTPKVGEYTIALVLMPAGMPLQLRSAVDFDWKLINIGG
jgi:hypothetical protein